MSITIRPGEAKDLPDIAAVDIAANPDHPIVSIPFAKASDRQAVYLDRHTYYFNHPEYHFIVATSDDEIVGTLLYREPEKGLNIPEWEPKLPDGTNLKFFETLLPLIEKNNARYDDKSLYEIDDLAVSPTQQRRGIGSLLIRMFLKSVDNDHAGSCVNSSPMARPLYERFGWRERSESRIDLSEFGMKEDYVGHNMKREGVVRSRG